MAFSGRQGSAIRARDMLTPSHLPEAISSSASSGERMEPMENTGICTLPLCLMAALRSLFRAQGRKVVPKNQVMPSEEISARSTYS